MHNDEINLLFDILILVAMLHDEDTGIYTMGKQLSNGVTRFAVK